MLISDLYLYTVIFGGVSFLISYLLTIYFKGFAVKYKFLDDPKSRTDKKQKAPIPFLGGVGFVVVCSILCSLLWLINKYNWFDGTELLQQNLIYPFRLYWIMFAIAIMLVGGIIDDKFALSSKWLFLYILIAVAVAVFFGGLKIEFFAYPVSIVVPQIFYLPELLAFFWILACTASTKFLDGHDGLVATTSIIALFCIASVSMFTNVNQPLIFLFSITWIFGIISFLVFNFPEAKLYLGESGSEIVGFVIGVLAILSGAKVATTSTVIGWFILDFIFVLWIRFSNHNPLFKADRNHWHHRLVALNLNKYQVLSFTAFCILLTSHIGLFFPSNYKILAIVFQILVIILIYFISERKKTIQNVEQIQKPF